ncbi:MAG: hypothetical protein LC714_00110 [Actinobacteria bacterium]|nr:hypothetical protein [Actinomycetota bacterium]
MDSSLFFGGSVVAATVAGVIALFAPCCISVMKRGPLSVYSLGVFSGVASSCCAPVLAGVIALSGIASSFGLALGLGAAYVFGMVAPLFVISLLWEHYDWQQSRLFRPRTFTYRLGPLRRTITGTSLASGILLALMGVATLYVGLAFDAMPASGGWQADLSVRLQGYGRAVTDALSWVPGWAAAIVLLAIGALLALRTLGQVGHGPDEEDEEPEVKIKEETLEQREA